MSRVIVSRPKTPTELKVEDNAILVKNRAEALLLALTQEHSVTKSAQIAIELKKDLNTFIESAINLRELSVQAEQAVTNNLRQDLQNVQ